MRKKSCSPWNSDANGKDSTFNKSSEFVKVEISDSCNEYRKKSSIFYLRIIGLLKKPSNLLAILTYAIATIFFQQTQDIYLFPLIYLFLFYSALVIGYKITNNKINFFLWNEPSARQVIKMFCIVIFMIYGVLLFTKLISPHIGTAILGLTFCLVIYFMLSNNIINRLSEHSTKHEHIRKDLANLYKQHKKFLLYFFKRVLFEINNQKERNKIMLEELGNTKIGRAHV